MPTFVQQGSNENTGTASTTVAVTGLTAIGASHHLCGFITAGATALTCTVKDGNNNAATMVPSTSGVVDNTNGNQSWMYYIPPSAQGGGATSVTATFSAATSNTAITVQEWSGILSTSPLDQSSLTNLATSTTPTGTSVTTGTNNELCFAGITADSNSPGTVSAGTNFAWTLRNTSATNLSVDESFVQSTAGSVAAQFHFTATAASQIGIMTFKPTAASQNPFIQSDWPNPQPQQWYRSWEKYKQQTPTVLNTFRQNDWPNPYPITWYRDWSQRFTITVPSPTKQLDWPNPQSVSWYQSYTQNLLQSTLAPLIQSVQSEYNWTIPPPVYWYEDWSQSLNTRITPTVLNTFRQSDWPNPSPVVWYQSWTENLLQSTLKPGIGNPFIQSNWPNPQPITWYQSWIEPGNVQLPFPTPFFQIVDSPLPVVPQPIDQTWVQNLAEFLQSETFPFSQKDWPLPYPVQWYKDWFQALTPYLPPPGQPFAQYDWPNPKDYQRIDESFWQALALILPPPPPPPPGPISSGRQISMEELNNAISDWSKRSYLFHQSNSLSQQAKDLANKRWKK